MNELESAEYVRQRLKPQPGDDLYLVLSDLLLGIQELTPRNVERVLDFGCGGSPYRPLFDAAIYHRADLAGTGTNLDFEYGADAQISAASAYYDCVLSTQVLEHVDQPTAYLAECRRVLKPGGQMILSTHGLFEDHACPYDYWRWTAFGLQKLVEAEGFEVECIRKLTTGPRAAVFIGEREQRRFDFSQAGRYGKALTFGIRVLRRLGAKRIHNACDASFPLHRVVDADQPGHNIYIVVVLRARRRAE